MVLRCVAGFDFHDGVVGQGGGQAPQLARIPFDWLRSELRTLIGRFKVLTLIREKVGAV